MEKYSWLIIIGVLLVFYLLLIVRQKRQEKKNREAIDNFKVGDRVVTHIGVYGKIKRIYNTTYGKTCILEIGTNSKIEIEMDIRYIAGIDEKEMLPDEEKMPEKQENKEQKSNKKNKSK